MTSYIVGFGQTSSGITLAAGDTMVAENGGTALRDTVNSGGVLTASGGFAEGDTINRGGLLVDTAFGGTNGCTFSGGTLIVSGGTANNDHIDAGGVVIVSGTFFFPSMADHETINNGGSMTVLSGGVAENTVDSGGSLFVASGGRLNAGGTGIDSVVLLGGLLDLQSGSIASGPIDFRSLSGGRLQIDGTVMPSDTISGFAQGDAIDLTGVAFGSGGSVSLLAGNVLQVSENGKAFELNLDRSQNFVGDTFQIADDGKGGTLITESGGPLPSGLFASPQLALSAFGANTGGWTEQRLYPRLLGDINGDGRADIVAFGGDGVYVSLANGNGTFQSPILANPNTFGLLPSAGGWTNQDLFPRELADLNGNGLADIVAFGDATFDAVPFGTAGFQETFIGFLFNAGPFGGGWISQDHLPRELGDVNGDGRADIVGFGAEGVYTALGNGNGFFQEPVLTFASFGLDPVAGGWISQNTYPRFVGDVTGNGRADIVAFGDAGTYVSLSNGDGTFAAPFLALPQFGVAAAAGGWATNELYPRVLGNVTGNGRDDIVAFAGDGVYVSLANPDGTFQQPFLALSGLGANAGFTSNDIYPREIADVNGDGRADIVAFAGDGVYVALANTNGTFQAPVFQTLASN